MACAVEAHEQTTDLCVKDDGTLRTLSTKGMLSYLWPMADVCDRNQGQESRQAGILSSLGGSAVEVAAQIMIVVARRGDKSRSRTSTYFSAHGQDPRWQLLTEADGGQLDVSLGAGQAAGGI